MYTDKTETPMSLSFQLFFEQIRQAHEIYEFHCFSQDFITLCEERRKDGLCHLPYRTLPDETELLDTAFRIFCKKRDCNVAYNDTLNMVMDEIESQIADKSPIASLSKSPQRAAIVIEDGIISAAFSSASDIEIEIIELDKNYATSEQRDAIYQELQNDLALKSCEYALYIPGFEEAVGIAEEN